MRHSVLGTLLVFLAGLALGGETLWWLIVLPDLQVFWVGELFYQAAPELPASYILRSGLYAFAYCSVWAALGMWCFGRKEVGS